MNKLECINENNLHVGELTEIINFDNVWNEEISVKWCDVCGAVVVDKMSDNRCLGRFVNMKFPKIIKRYRKAQ